jgi:hypothetical protein
VSNGGGNDPFWSATGNEIVFRRDDTIVSVPFHPQGDRAAFGNETTLVRLPPSSTFHGIAPDGRFLIARLAEPEPTPGIRVVLNWFEELKSRTR